MNNIEYKMLHSNNTFKTNLVHIFTVTGKNQPNKPRIKKLIHCLSSHICNSEDDSYILSLCTKSNYKQKKSKKKNEKEVA